MPRLLCLLVGAILFASATPHAQPVVDGLFDEWDVPLYTDGTGDGSPVDLGRLWGSGDAAYIYLAFEVGTELSLQSEDAITLYVDTDGDASTGEAIAGIGAEVRYAFGERTGQVTLPGQSPTIVGHATLGLFSAPTVTSDRFELALRRDAIVGGAPVFPAPTLRVVIVGADGDVLPDETGGVLVKLDASPPDRLPVDLDRRPGDLRVLSYNVLRDRITEAAYRAPFERIFQTTQPDVIAMQEVYDSSAADIATLLEDFLPGTSWYGAGSPGTDAMVLSRYPILETTPLCERSDVPTSCNLAALLDLGNDRQLYVVSMHPPCCGNDAGRQAEFDLLAAHIRDARASGVFTATTALIVAGDMNLVGDRRQVQTLLEGDIVDTDRFGPDAPPDADGTALADAAPRTTGRPANYTWTEASSSFSPGRLDYIVYSDALLEAGNEFSLYTPALTSDELTHFNLEAGDTDVSDHLPLVTDFAFRSSTSTAEPAQQGMSLDAISPNPTSTSATVRYRLDRRGPIRLTVLDTLGRTVQTIETGSRGPGRSEARVDTRSLAPGTYVVRLEAGGRVLARRFSVVR